MNDAVNIVDQNQRDEAATRADVNLVITAGAGTGKTSLLIERILHDLLEHGTSLDRIAAITFTEKAAAELRERLEEALEAVVQIVTRPGRPPPRYGKEAPRVLRRILDRIEGETVVERSRAAIECLDRSTLSTIHSFCAELLRRHPSAAGVDPEFEIDQGEAERTLLDELWGEHLQEVFGDPREDEELAAWRRLLERYSMAELEEIARPLCRFGMPESVLESSDPDVQVACLKVYAVERGAEVESLRQAVEGAAGVRKEFIQTLEILNAVFTAVAQTGELPTAEALDARRLVKESCAVGKGAELSEAESVGLNRAMKRLIRAVRELPEIDVALAVDVALAFEPLSRKFRQEFLRRGNVSNDALILLARDLLRDHPDVRRRESRRLDRLLIDEFQDTDPLQYEIAFFLAEEIDGPPARDAYEARLQPGKLFIVGDPKQSIYRFRGADIEAYHRAVATVQREQGRRLSLRANFRSVPELSEPLDGLFAELFDARDGLNPEYEAVTSARDPGGGTRVEIWSVGKREQLAAERRKCEAEAIAEWIRNYVLEEAVGEGGAYKSVAILFRALTEVPVYLRKLRAAGIPYVVEGGRGFFERHEVELLLCLLRAVVNPADPVALVSWLRSSAGAVSDEELQRFVEEPRTEPGSAVRPPWSLHARPDPDAFGALARALKQLRDFAARHRADPLDRIARAALRETSLLVAVAASYEGAQRVANVEKAVRRIGELAGDGKLSAEEVLDRIEFGDVLERAEGDSPLADETVDAVRILSIHKAKGLEWPVVVLPDLVREPGVGAGGRGGPQIAAARAGSDPHDPPSVLALKYRGRKTPAWPRHAALSERHEAAELRRLLYVAATRAQERLIFVVGGAGRSSSAPWVDALSAWGYRIGKHFPDDRDFAGGAVLHRRVAAPIKMPSSTLTSVVDPRMLAAVDEHLALRGSLLPDGREIFHLPSGETAPPVDREDDDDAASIACRISPRVPTKGRSGAVARAAGTAIHRLLEVWDRGDADWLFEMAPRAAAGAAPEGGADARAVTDEVLSILERARESGKLAALSRLEILGREVPLLYRDDDGTLWEGTVDLLAGTPDAPEIIDYKTGRVDDLSRLERAHAAQLGIYAEGVRRAVGPSSEVRSRIEPLPPG